MTTDHPADPSAEPRATSDKEPRLGLASTDELLDELLARLGRTFHHEVSELPAVERAVAIKTLRLSVPRSEREYRTVDYEAMTSLNDVPDDQGGLTMPTDRSEMTTPGIGADAWPEEAWVPSVDICAFCTDSECDGIACIASLDPNDDVHHDAIEELHDLIRKGRAWNAAAKLLRDAGAA